MLNFPKSHRKISWKMSNLIKFYWFVFRTTRISTTWGNTLNNNSIVCMYCSLILLIQVVTFDLHVGWPLVIRNLGNVCTNPGNWTVMYLCVSGVDFTSFYDFAIRLWKCSDSVILFAFHLFHYFKFQALGKYTGLQFYSTDLLLYIPVVRSVISWWSVLLME